MSYKDVSALRQKYTRASARERWGEAAAVAVLLGFDPIAVSDRFTPHVTRDGVDWDKLLADRSWSPTQRFLIGTAAGIWRGRRTEVDIAQVTFLDDAFFSTWLAMISAMAVGHVPVEPGGCSVIHVPTAEALAELAAWCSDRGLTFAALRGEA